MKKLIFGSLLFSLFFFNSNAQNLQPDDSNAVINILVLDKEHKPIAGEKVMVQSVKKQKSYKGITNDSGKFSVHVPYGCDYSFRYQQLTTDTAYGKKLTIPPGIKDGIIQRYTLNFTLNNITLRKTYTLHDVFFETAKSNLRPESDKELNELAEYLSYHKKTIIEVAGYTDNVGKDDANQILSQARADVVRNYLIKKGISGDNITAKGYGATSPVATNDTPEGRQQNRRTEVHIKN
jgi:outer membrane protein OmpA-like peptidoglycan-associated protein